MSELVVDTSTVATALGQDHRAQHYSRGDVEIRFENAEKGLKMDVPRL